MTSPAPLKEQTDCAPAPWKHRVEKLSPEHVPQLRKRTTEYCTKARASQGRLADPRALADVAVVVTEMVTNVLKHATPPGQPVDMGLLLMLDGDDVLIVVTDPSPDGPMLDTTEPGQEEGGLGLGLVRDITLDRWGWHPLPVGKAVWAQCPLPVVPAEPNRTES
ncbi:ATP-binding protein [Streptomyces sp. NRRL S-350]|uniref:ATP-binding protein n=1 Tax=Streptomyces sp. NRRL S-350 TaxID=1463902 RepID=UPI00068F5F4C|nr:ATP-binding protein [Streptomyces sp. NRRL S-350]